MTQAQRKDYKSWLSDLKRKARKNDQKDRNAKQEAQKNFMILQGQLYRKAGIDELDADADIAMAAKPREVVMVDAAYAAITSTHERVGPHAELGPTWNYV